MLHLPKTVLGKGESMATDPPAPARKKTGIPRELMVFLANTDALATSIHLFLKVSLRTLQEEAERFKKFLERHGTPETNEKGDRSYRLDAHWHEARRLGRKLHSAASAAKILPRSHLVSLVSQYDSFLGRLVKCLYQMKPELINASEKPLTFAELQKFSSMDEARDYVLEREIEALLRKSHTEQFEWLENKFGITLRKDLDCWKQFIEVTERRNLFVHTDGMISNQYLAVCRSSGSLPSPEPALGSELHVDLKYFEAAHKCIVEIAVTLAHVTWRKIDPKDLSSADANLVDILFDLLVSERWDLAVALGEFATNVLKKHSSDERRRILVVNLAQAYKWRGQHDKCSALLANHDWSATSETFQLALAVLSDDLEHAASCMKRIGNDSKKVWEDAYREWPLFREFRKTDVFLKTHEEVFGRPFSTLEQVSDMKLVDQLQAKAPPTDTEPSPAPTNSPHEDAPNPSPYAP